MCLNHKQKGAVSVFIMLILLPVLLFDLMAVDIARILSSRVVISDAGELTMNAALAQYDEELLDQYGLFAMEKPAEEIASDLEDLFLKSLNGNAAAGTTNFDQLLAMISENFEAISVSNTEVYRTEIEKQQILEYMKYRAPVCLTDLVIEKFQFLKNTGKYTNAIEKQSDFSESMEECQDAFEDAKNALEKLNSTISEFPSQDTIIDKIDEAEREMVVQMARGYLMTEAIEKYKGTCSDADYKQCARNYINKINQVKRRNNNRVDDGDAYDLMLEAISHRKSMAAPDGGRAEKAIEPGEKPDENDDPEVYAQWQEDKELYDDFLEAQRYEKEYIAHLSGFAYACIQEHHDELNGYYNTAKNAETYATRAFDRLEEVRRKINAAKSDYNKWDQASQELDDEQEGGMKAQVEDYRDFFGNDLSALDELEAKVNADKEYFKEIKNNIKEYTIYDYSVALTDVGQQSNVYSEKARSALRNLDRTNSLYYHDIENARQNSFVTNTKKNEQYTKTMQRINEDAFFKKLKEYCQKNGNQADANQKTTENNQKINENANAGNEAKNIDVEGLFYEWGTGSQSLPSYTLGLSSFTPANEKLTNASCSVDLSNKSSRKNIIAKTRDSIKEASGFMDGLSRLLEQHLENLYIAEYAMQMFSCYTCDKKMNAHQKIDVITKPISISGYELNKNAAYKSELEYIIWGGQTAAQNIASTFMLLFGVRLLFNSIFCFTNRGIINKSRAIATVIASGLPCLIPVITVALTFGFAICETAIDINYLRQGYGVVLVKSEDTFETLPLNIHKGNAKGSSKNKLTFDYGEYLRVFLNGKMIIGGEDKMLARIADCIQVNTDSDILTEYTMIAIHSDIKVKTSFLQKIADWAKTDWEYGNSYPVNYQSVLAY